MNIQNWSAIHIIALQCCYLFSLNSPSLPLYLSLLPALSFNCRPDSINVCTLGFVWCETVCAFVCVCICCVTNNLYSSIWWMNKLPLVNIASEWAYRQTNEWQRSKRKRNTKWNKHFEVKITKVSASAAETTTILWLNYWLNVLELFDA